MSILDRSKEREDVNTIQNKREKLKQKINIIIYMKLDFLLSSGVSD